MKTVTLKSVKDIEKVSFENSKGLKAEFLKNNGALFALTYAEGDLMLNLSQGHVLEGNVQNIYLRVFEGENIAFKPLTGPASGSSVSYNDKCIEWKGEFKGVCYVLTFNLSDSENAWFWTVELEGDGVECDVVYFQDKGIAAKGAVRNNEFYTSHYIDNYVFDTDNGYVIAARQNQQQGTGFPYLVEGSFNKVDGFATDGIQFFGIDYKNTDVPAALVQEDMPNKKLQGEYGASVLKTAKEALKAGEKARVVFYAMFNENHPEATSEKDLEVVAAARCVFDAISADKSSMNDIKVETSAFTDAEFFNADDLSSADVEKYFGSELKHKEEKDGKLLSFFLGGTHVILKEKDVICERPQGHIVRSGKNLYPSDDSICSSNYMYGCFNAQIAVGNTSFNQMLSHPRSLLNLLKSNGQRVFVTINGKTTLLGLPSAYEIGFTGCRWIYKNADATIIVKVWASLNDSVIRMNIESDVDAEFTVYNEISLGANEYDQGGNIVIEDSKVTMTPEAGSMILNKYPNAKFFATICPEALETIGGAELISDSAITDLPALVIKTKATKKFGMTFGGNIHAAEKADDLLAKYSQAGAPSYEEDTALSEDYFKSVLNYAELSFDNEEDEEVSKISDLLFWYLHNGLVHFSIPHGLEQYSGAAWGVRDVLQGSIEFLLACGKSEPVKDIIKTVFSHQFIENGDWPQWFMFDEFKYIQDQHSHGDIIVWPLKAVSQYIEYSNDFSILDEKVPYTNHGCPEKSFTEETYTILDHMKFEIKAIKDSFVKGTNLPCYGGGDWNDTLQPADQSLKSQMVSGWTATICWQYMNQFANVLKKAGIDDYAEEVKALADLVKADFKKYIIKDGQVSGFIYVNEDGSVDNMIHASDTRTGIKYRLLPMTRCMIAEMFDVEEKDINNALIKEHLRFPDGVRLMEKAAPYNGGVSTTFKRAEQAAYCGREVNLQYVHAHLRYIEAMLKIGEADEAFLAAKQVAPITIDKVVPNAGLRQSNAYFSSADSDFADRYELAEGMDKVKNGEVTSKGGWRIYSSGPGIYMHQIINNMIGIRRKFDKVVLDPVIPAKLDGLKAAFKYGAKKVTYKYVTGGANTCGVKEMKVNGTVLTGEELSNPYRKAGIAFDGAEFEKLLVDGDNVVEVVLG